MYQQTNELATRKGAVDAVQPYQRVRPKTVGAIVLLLLAAILLFSAIGCSPSASGEPVFRREESAQSVAVAHRPITMTLTILHTNDTWGYLDPCG